MDDSESALPLHPCSLTALFTLGFGDFQLFSLFKSKGEGRSMEQVSSGERRGRSRKKLTVYLLDSGWHYFTLYFSFRHPHPKGDREWFLDFSLDALILSLSGGPGHDSLLGDDCGESCPVPTRKKRMKSDFKLRKKKAQSSFQFTSYSLSYGYQLIFTSKNRISRDREWPGE